MSQTAADELGWWDGLRGDDIAINTGGHPPYNVDAVADVIMRRIQIPATKATVLDLGCGPGRLTNVIARRYSDVEVIGIDIAPSLLSLAAAHCPPNVRLHAGDGRSIPEHVGELDGAWSVTMLQHIPPDAQADYICQVGELLRPGARFAFTASVGVEVNPLQFQVRAKDVFDWCDSAGIPVQEAWVDERMWTWFIAEKPRRKM